MFESAIEKNNFIIAENFNGENFPLSIENQLRSKRELFFLSPNQRFPKTKLKYRKITRLKSRWYNWLCPASAKVWKQEEGDEVMISNRSNFRHYVHFERCITHYQILPVEIPFYDRAGERRKYKPLALLTFSKELMFNSMKPVLVDVRSNSNIVENWDWFYPAWREARRFAQKARWNFCLIRDDFFQTLLYYNASFLLRYRSYPFNEEYFGRIMQEMRRLKITTVQELMNNVSNDNAECASILPYIWKLIDANFIFFDIKLALSMNTRIGVFK